MKNMAKRVDKSGLLNVGREIIVRDKLVEGKYYVGIIGSDQYLYQNRTVGNYTAKEISYIHKKSLNLGSIGFKFNFTNNWEATEDEIELLQESIKNNKYTEPPLIAQYIVKLSTTNYILATDKQGKVEWTEEIQYVLKYLKDNLKISYKGSVNFKPKTLKDLKELVNNTPLKLNSIKNGKS